MNNNRFNKAYFLRSVEYLYGVFQNGGRYSVEGRIHSPETIRMYAAGTPDISKFIVPSKAKGRNNRFVEPNYDTTPPKPLRKQLRLLKEYLMMNPAEQLPTVTDFSSVFEKNKAIAKMKLAVDPRFGGMAAELGMPMEQTPDVEEPQDVEMLQELGGIRLKKEIFMKDLLDLSLKNDATDLIERMWNKDIIELNAAAAFIVMKEGRVETRYVDPATLICRNSIYSDGRDQDFRGFSEELPFTAIAPLLDQDEGGYQDALELFKSFGGVFESALQIQEVIASARGGYFKQKLSFDKKKVVTLFWKESVTERFITGIGKYGNEIFDKVSLDAKLDKRHIAKGKRMVDITQQRIMKCRWVVGTKVVFDYGEYTDAIYTGIKGAVEPQFPITVFLGQEPSVVEDCIPLVDSIIRNTFQIRKLLSKIPPAPRMMIDKSRVHPEISIGQRKYNLLQMLENYSEDGLFIVETIPYDTDAGEARGTLRDVVEFLPSGVTEDITMCLNIIGQEMQSIRELTAVNEVADGSNTSPEMLKSVLQAHQQTALSANMDSLRSISSFKVRVSKLILLSWLSSSIPQSILDVLGYSDMTSEEIVKDLSKSTWEIEISRNSIELRRFLEQMLNTRAAEFSPESSFAIQKALIEGDLAKCKYLIAKYSKKAADKAQQNAMELQQAQPQAQAQADAIMAEAKGKLYQIEYAEKAKLEELKHVHRMAELKINSNANGVINKPLPLQGNQTVDND